MLHLLTSIRRSKPPPPSPTTSHHTQTSPLFIIFPFLHPSRLSPPTPKIMRVEAKASSPHPSTNTIKTIKGWWVRTRPVSSTAQRHYTPDGLLTGMGHFRTIEHLNTRRRVYLHSRPSYHQILLHPQNHLPESRRSYRHHQHGHLLPI